MIIKTKSEKEYVYRYVQALQGLYRLQPREVDVAAAVVYRYFILEKARKLFSTQEKRDNYNPMVELRKPEVLKLVYEQDLGIDFEVFRNYVSKLKDKRFFTEKGINEHFIPGTEKSTIEIWMS